MRNVSHLLYMFERDLMSNTISAFLNMVERNHCGNLTVVEFAMLIAFFRVIVTLYALLVKTYSTAWMFF